MTSLTNIPVKIRENAEELILALDANLWTSNSAKLMDELDPLYISNYSDFHREEIWLRVGTKHGATSWFPKKALYHPLRKINP